MIGHKQLLILRKCPVSLRQSAPIPATADPTQLQGKQLKAYTIVHEHLEAEAPPPLRMIVYGTAGTGKSYLINCLRLLQNKVRVAAPTGVAAFNVDGHTLHSLLGLPTKGEYKDLTVEHLQQLQNSTWILDHRRNVYGRQ